MKLPGFALKTLILIITITYGFSINSCYAQTIVGKWKRSGTKFFVKDNTTGKQVPVSAGIQQKYDQAAAARGYKETLEIKPDNTYTSTVTAGDEKPVAHNGIYSLSGKDLDMKIPLVNNEKTTITIQSVTGSIMVWDMLFMGKLMEITYTKM